MKACFIGLGSIGTKHLNNLSSIMKDTDSELIVHALRHSKDFNENKLVNKNLFTYSELDDDYDVCFITNPTSLHYDAILNTIGKSKYYFVEKPIFESTHYDIDLIKKQEDKYYIACPLRYTKVFEEIKKINQNEKILSVYAKSSSYLPDWRKGIDYRTCYSAKESLGGGVDIDLIHELDYICELFGFPKEEKQFRKKISDLEIDSNDYASYILNYENKMVEIHLDYFSRKAIRFLEIITSEKNYICDFVNHKVVELNTSKIIDCSEEVNDFYLKEMKEFLLIAKGDKENNNNLSHALKVLKLAKGEV